MSRSIITCALDARTTTIVRVKSSGGPSCSVTDFRMVGYGLDDLHGRNGKKARAKIADTIGTWSDEPLAVTIAPSSLLTLSAWFPDGASNEQCEALSKMEASGFLHEPDGWHWQSIPVGPAGDQSAGLEHRVIMFSKAEPVRSLLQELGKRFRLCRHGLHFEPMVRWTTGSPEPTAVLELEEEYAVFFVSRNGRADYFRYWPVKHSSDREFFAISEIESSSLERVSVMGLAADAATLKRLSAATTRTLQPLDWSTLVDTSEARGCQASTGALRAVGMAMMALADGYRCGKG